MTAPFKKPMQTLKDLRKSVKAVRTVSSDKARLTHAKKIRTLTAQYLSEVSDAIRSRVGKSGLAKINGRVSDRIQWR